MAEQNKCKNCGKELSNGDSIKGYCHDCWCAHLRDLRAFYKPYEARLCAVLEKKRHHMNPGTLSGLDETGRPLKKVRQNTSPVIPLRDDEYAVSLFHVRDAVLALPDNGIGLRYITPSANGDFMKQIEYHGYQFLAAVSEGVHVYALRDDGKIYHTNPFLPGPITISSRLELHREVWHTFFSEEQLRESAACLNNPNVCIRNVDGGDTYFDPAQRMFFFVSVDGSYADGYDVTYPRLSKEMVIDSLLSSRRLFETWEECRSGEVPLTAQLDQIEEAPADMAYIPEENFGYGLHFM